MFFINERPVSALQSHHQALHKHEWTTLHGVNVELSIHVYVAPDDGFEKPKTSRSLIKTKKNVGCD
jgi:hypothetical protein